MVYTIQYFYFQKAIDSNFLIFSIPNIVLKLSLLNLYGVLRLYEIYKKNKSINPLFKVKLKKHRVIILWK